MADEITVPEEKKTRKYYESEQFDLWFKYYTDKESETYGNAVRSSLKAYGKDVNAKYTSSEYNSASVRAWENIRKARALGMIFIENNGLSFEKMLQFAMKQMLDDKTKNKKDWWDSLMKTAGYQQEENTNLQVNVPIQINNAIQEKIDRFK